MTDYIKLLPASLLALTLIGCSTSEQTQNPENSTAVHTASSSATTENSHDALSETLLPLAQSMSEEVFVKESLQRVVPSLIREYVPESLVEEVSSLEILSIDSLMQKDEITAPLESFYQEAQISTDRATSFFSLLTSMYESLKTLIINALSNFFSSNSSSLDSQTDSSSSLHVNSSSLSSFSSSIFLLSSSSTSITMSSSFSSSSSLENNETLSSSSASSSDDEGDVDAIFATEFILSGEISQKSSTTLNIEGAVKYQVPNLPSWVSLDESTGLLTMTPDGSLAGHERFDVVVTMQDKKVTYKNALRISLYKPLSKLLQSIKETAPTSARVIGGKAETTTGGAANLITNADGINHTLMVQYFERYNTNTRMVAIDLATNTVKSVLDEETSQGEGYNAGSHVPIGNGREMFAFNKGYL